MSTHKNTHLTLEDRIIIQRLIQNGSSIQAIAHQLAKDKSTIGKEIRLQRIIQYKHRLVLECSSV